MNSQLGRSVVVAALASVVMCLAAGASAQGLSDMRGTVVDTSGGALARRHHHDHQSGIRHLP